MFDQSQIEEVRKPFDNSDELMETTCLSENDEVGELHQADANYILVKRNSPTASQI